MAPLLYGTWPFITFFKVMWFAVALWCKCCSCLSWLAGHFPTQTVVRHTWVSPCSVLVYATTLSFILHFCFLVITYSVLVNKSAAVFEHYLWHFFSESFQGFPALWDYRWGQLRTIYTALQRTVLVRLNTSSRNECHLGFHYISLAKGNFLKFTHRIFIRLLHFENFGPRHHGKIHTYSSSSDLYCHC